MERPAVVVATYDQPRFLDLALRAWSGQSVLPARILVADDGSGPETRAVSLSHGAVHVRREREGSHFGKCSAVNGAIRRARELSCDYLLFTDGDCLPAHDLFERHLQAARPGRFVSGGVVRLSRAQSEAITAEEARTFAFEKLRGDKRLYSLPRPLGRALDLLTPRRAPFKGGNSSAALADLVRVNGYDERFGWGSEDKELGERLGHAGIHGCSIRYSAPVFHLWHERPYVNQEVIRQNRALLAETRRTRSIRTPQGLE